MNSIRWDIGAKCIIIQNCPEAWRNCFSFVPVSIVLVSNHPYRFMVSFSAHSVGADERRETVSGPFHSFADAHNWLHVREKRKRERLSTLVYYPKV